ncbi:MAG: FAD-binding oxidoreductase [Gemmatimonas sp.]
MTQARVQTLTAWGNSSTSSSLLCEPDSKAALAAFLNDTRQAQQSGGVIARGYGRSYGDQCLNDRGTVISTTGLTTIHSFDASTGVIHCDAGVSFAQIMRHCLPQGWIPQVCPGTAAVSMGGAIANDVHGKNQRHAGTFMDHVEWFDLLLPTGDLERVSHESNAELFAATAGGIGLTGIIVAVQFRLRRVASNAVRLTESRVQNLDEFLELLPSASEANEFAVGWIDGLKSGLQLGRGILEVASFTSDNIPAPPQRSINWPVQLPPFVLNRYSVGAFNAGYYHRVPKQTRTRAVHVDKFLYPLDAIHNWNRLYGKPGVYQFQCGLPFDDARSGLKAVMDEVTRSQSASFLAVLKYMGRAGTGPLSFPLPGFSLALDFPRRPDTFALMKRLHEIVLRYQGRVYLAKDSCISAGDFARMYPRHEEFQNILRRVDPTALMRSDMSRRLGIHAHSSTTAVR